MKRHYPDAQERYMRKLDSMDKENKEWEDGMKRAKAKKRKPGQPRKAPTKVVAIRIDKFHAGTLEKNLKPKQRRPWLQAQIDLCFPEPLEQRIAELEQAWNEEHKEACAARKQFAEASRIVFQHEATIAELRSAIRGFIAAYDGVDDADLGCAYFKLHSLAKCTQ